MSKYLSSQLQILPRIVSKTWLNRRYNNDLVISLFLDLDEGTNIVCSAASKPNVVAPLQEVQRRPPAAPHPRLESR